MGYMEGENNDYRGISGIKGKKSGKSDFLERFQGRQSLMNKDGHIGIVQNAQ